MKFSRKKLKSSSDEAGLDMSSLMDIIFILLIFVMMSISFAKDFKIMEIDVPESENGSSPIDKSLTISLKKGGTLFLNKEEVTINQLKELSGSGHFKEKIVTINVDKSEPYEKFISILDAIKKGGADKIQLGTE